LAKIKKRAKPPKPDDLNYSKKQNIALSLLQGFIENFSNIQIKSVLADALYGTQNFMDKVA